MKFDSNFSALSAARLVTRSTFLTATLVAILGAPAAARGATPRADTEGDALVAAVGDRLQLADQVAIAKWHRHQTIEDSARERVVIDGAVEEGDAHGLDREYLRDFFADQIAASKIVQIHWINLWRRGEREVPSGAPADLGTALRPELDRLQHVLIGQLVAIRTLARSNDCERIFSAASQRYGDDVGLDAAHRVALEYALRRVCLDHE